MIYCYCDVWYEIWDIADDSLPPNICVKHLLSLLLIIKYGPLGMILSFILVSEDNSLLEKIVAEVTDEEIGFMKMFQIDDGDGTLDCREFIILTAVRIGAAPPALISQINERFAMLDRKHEGSIKYEDIVYGFKPKRGGMKKMDFKRIVHRHLSKGESSDSIKSTSFSIQLTSTTAPSVVADGESRTLLRGMSQQRVHPVDASVECLEEGRLAFDDWNREQSRSQDMSPRSFEGSLSEDNKSLVKAERYICGEVKENEKENEKENDSESDCEAVHPLPHDASSHLVASGKRDAGAELLHSTSGASVSDVDAKPLVSPPSGLSIDSRKMSIVNVFADAAKRSKSSLQEPLHEDVLMKRERYSNIANDKMGRLILQHSSRRIEAKSSMENLVDIFERDDATFSRRCRALVRVLWRRAKEILCDPYFQVFIAW